MNNMRKLIETIEQVNESEDPVVSELGEIYEEMEQLIERLRSCVRRMKDKSIGERARRGVLAYFEMALNKNHDWLGGNMTTLADIIEELQDPDNQQEDEDADFDYVSPVANDQRTQDLRDTDFDPADGGELTNNR